MKKNESESLWIWGYHPVNEFLLKSPANISRICCLPTFDRKKKGQKLISLALKKGFQVEKVSDFNKFFNPAGVNHQGICALITNNWDIEFDTLYEISKKKEIPTCLFLDGITDPQNLGAIVRSCAAFGVDAILLPEKGSVGITSTVVRVSSGAISRIKVCYIADVLGSLDRLKEMGFTLIAMTPEAKEKIWEKDLKIPLTIILGAEGEGIRQNIKKKCDFLLSIPLKNLGSLNVATACGISLYEIIRQREF